MRIALVINAKAGAMPKDAADVIREKIAAAGLSAALETNADAMLPARLEAAAAQPDIEALVVAGGDGTLECAASLMAGRELPLGILPTGTMNLLGKDLGVPLDLDAAIRNLQTGTVKRIDLGEVNGRVFLTASVLGMPAHMARLREAQRGGVDLRGVSRFAFGMFRHFGRYAKVDAVLTINGEARRRRFRVLAVVNNDFVEQPGRILVRDPVDGGRLTMYVLEHLSLWLTLRLGFGFALGDWRRLSGLERYPITDLKIDSTHQALRVMNDGEAQLIEAPLHYRIRPKCLCVIVPRAGALAP